MAEAQSIEEDGTILDRYGLSQAEWDLYYGDSDDPDYNEEFSQEDWDNLNESYPTVSESFIDGMYFDLEELLSPKHFAQLEEAFDTARKLAEKLGLKQEVNDPDNPLAWEKGLLFIILSKRWNEAKTLDDKKYIARQLGQLYVPDETDRLIVHTLNEVGGQPRVIGKDLIKIAWPESNGSVEWVKANIVKDNLVVFPFDQKAANKYYDEIFEKEKIPPSQRVKAAGFADPMDKLVFVFSDAKPHVIAHELNHIKFDGLRVGLLGTSIDEGVTEWLARTEIGDLAEAKSSFDLSIRSSLSYELDLLDRIWGDNPKLKTLIEARYKKANNETSHNLAIALIGQYGLENYLDLYLAKPNVFLGKNKVGYISTSAWNNKTKP